MEKVSKSESSQSQKFEVIYASLYSAPPRFRILLPYFLMRQMYVTLMYKDVCVYLVATVDWLFPHLPTNCESIVRIFCWDTKSVPQHLSRNHEAPAGLCLKNRNKAKITAQKSQRETGVKVTLKKTQLSFRGTFLAFQSLLMIGIRIGKCQM